MKKILIAAVALSALSAPAFAQTAAVTVKGNVVPFCTVGLAASETITIGPIPSSGAAIVAGLNAIQGARPGRVVCNGMGSTVTATATPFTSPNSLTAAQAADALAAGFTNTVNYTVDLKKVGTGYVQNPASTAVVITASSSSATPASRAVGLVNSTFEIDLNNAAVVGGPTATLIAGDYSGTVTYVVAASL
jgi:hypothetical protein